ncbi:MAG TPA: PHP domain-containing protein, partial [Chitinophagaceae bacterium]|nr:PHP domain-containing protein [Chitinophagaceae bacterium]
MYLNCKTFFSFRYGTYKTDELVKAGVETGATALALTNINNTCDAWDFYEFCLAEKIKPILGAEIRNEDWLCYVLLARNIEGFMQINQFLSDHLQQKTVFPARPVFSSSVWIIYPLGRQTAGQLAENEVVGVRPSEVNKLYSLGVEACPGKFVVLHAVSFQDKKNFNLHRLLRAIDKNTLL